MGRKGFTLVEMLAVVVLIGLLIVVIVLKVRPAINDSKNGVSDASANNLVSILEDYFFESKLKGEFTGCSYDFGNDTNTCTGFIFTGEKPTGGVISLSDEGIINGILIFGDYSYNIVNNSITNKVNIVVEDNIGTEYVFDYNGNEQVFDAEYTGYYKLEVWGAQGGTYDETYYGGYGGYSVGSVKLKKNDRLYINVGGSGSSGFGSITGGYNGGGTGYGSGCNGVTNRYGASGGGATHIATISGLLSTLQNDRNKILIVAGGGGGSFYYARAYGSGASGGGYQGVMASWTNNGHNYYIQATGGTQSAGGLFGNSYSNLSSRSSASFGHGENFNGSNCYEGSGGGGGYYGGGAGAYSPAAGGSGYIGNNNLINKLMYCYDCTESSDTTTKTVSTIGSSSLRDTTNCLNGYSTSPVSKCSKANNGYAKITYLGKEI